MIDSQEGGKVLDLEPPKHVFALIVTLVIIITFIILLLIALSSFDVGTFTFSWKDQGKNNFIIFLVSVFLGFIGNILATIVWAKWLEHYFKIQIKNKLEIIRSFGDPDLIQDIFKDLKYYDNRYCEDYRIQVNLCKHSTLDLLVCKVKYRYKKVFKNNELVFQFIRIQSEDQIHEIEHNETTLADNYLENEFYYRFDERSYPELSKIENPYKLLYLEVIIDGKPTRLKPKETVESHRVEYQANINNKGTFKMPITIDYEVQYLIEKESHLFFTIELPTKDVRCEFDYSEVMDLVDLYAYDFLSSHRGPIPLHSRNEPKIRLMKNDWVLPKSSFMFIWYNKC